VCRIATADARAVVCAEGLREKAAQAEADERRLFLAGLKPRPSFCGLHAGKGSETGSIHAAAEAVPCPKRFMRSALNCRPFYAEVAAASAAGFGRS